MEIITSSELARVPVTVLCVKGEINAETSGALLEAARKAHAGGAIDLLLDLSEVPYISSWGIRALSDIFSMLRPLASKESAPTAAGVARSQHLKLLNPTRPVLRVLALAGLDAYLETFTDRQRALDSF